MPETRARRKIRLAAEARGLVIEDMGYAPIGAMVEMSGREGGWEVWFTAGTHALGYNADEVVEWIEKGMADPRCDGCARLNVKPSAKCRRCGHRADSLAPSDQQATPDQPGEQSR